MQDYQFLKNKRKIFKLCKYIKEMYDIIGGMHMNIKKYVYIFVLKMILHDMECGILHLTGKQKNQLESLIWKVESM